MMALHILGATGATGSQGNVGQVQVRWLSVAGGTGPNADGSPVPRCT